LDIGLYNEMQTLLLAPNFWNSDTLRKITISIQTRVEYERYIDMSTLNLSKRNLLYRTDHCVIRRWKVHLNMVGTSASFLGGTEPILWPR
jgi:hypothetical protein